MRCDGPSNTSLATHGLSIPVLLGYRAYNGRLGLPSNFSSHGGPHCGGPHCTVPHHSSFPTEDPSLKFRRGHVHVATPARQIEMGNASDGEAVAYQKFRPMEYGLGIWNAKLGNHIGALSNRTVIRKAARGQGECPQ